MRFVLMILGLLLLPVVTSADIITGLVLHLKFDDGSGTTATDSSGQAHHGTVTGPSWVAGKIGGALDFVQAELDFVHVAHSFNSTDVTFAAWVDRHTMVSSGYLVNKFGSVSRGWGIFVHQTESLLGINDDTNATDVQSYVTDTGTGWHHIVAMIDGGEQKLYIDGQLVGSGILAAGPFGFTGDFYIGMRNGTSNAIDGIIDEVRIYDRALTDADVQELFEFTGTADITTDLVGHWRLDDGSGTTATDDSATGAHGTLVGPPSWVAGEIGSNALDFDAAGSDYVRLFTAQQVSTAYRSIGNNNSYTIAAWVLTSLNLQEAEDHWRCDQHILTLRDSDAITKVPFFFGIRDTFLCLGRAADDINDDERKLGTVAINDGQWHHVAAVIANDMLFFYIDGALDVQHTFTVAIGDTSVGTQNSEMVIGAAARDSAVIDLFWDGLIDDVRLYSRALSSLDIEALAAFTDEVPPVVTRRRMAPMGFR